MIKVEKEEKRVVEPEYWDTEFIVGEVLYSKCVVVVKGRGTKESDIESYIRIKFPKAENIKVQFNALRTNGPDTTSEN